MPEGIRRLIKQRITNGLLAEYILADSWFSSAKNMNFIYQQHSFILPLKSNRKLALSLADKHKDKYQPIDLFVLEKNQVLSVYLEGVDFPLLLTIARSLDENAVNHLFLFMLAFVKPETLKISTKMNHFVMISLLPLNALKVAYQKLQYLKASNSLLNHYA